MKILLIEDELKTSQSIKSWLEEYQIDVDCAYDGDSGLSLVGHKSYDVILSDVILPKLGGFEFCRKVRDAGIRTPIMMLSALSQPEDKVTGLDAGADDYMSKPFDFKELLARINALVRRSTDKDAHTNILTFADLELNLNTFEVHRAGKKIILTPREFALLEYLVRNQGRVLSKAEISEKVWNIDIEYNTNVIEVYVNYLRNKIDKGFDKKLIYTQFGIGYYLKHE